MNTKHITFYLGGTVKTENGNRTREKRPNVKTFWRARRFFAGLQFYLRSMGYFYEEFLKMNLVEELKTSFSCTRKKIPRLLELRSVFCRIAYQLRDYKEARDQFNLLNGRVI